MPCHGLSTISDIHEASLLRAASHLFSSQAACLIDANIGWPISICKSRLIWCLLCLLLYRSSLFQSISLYFFSIKFPHLPLSSPRHMLQCNLNIAPCRNESLASRFCQSPYHAGGYLHRDVGTRCNSDIVYSATTRYCRRPRSISIRKT